MNLCLVRVLRLVIRADSDPARQALFANLIQARRGVRLAYRTHERLRGTWASALLVSCYGLASFLSIARTPNRHATVLAVAAHENAQREVTRVLAWLGPADCGWLRGRMRNALGAAALVALWRLFTRGRVLQAIKVVRTIDRRHGFLVSCRSAAALGWYARTKAILRARPPGAVLVSSDSNPEEVGFVGAARSLHVPQVFVAHAYPTPFSPPLDFSLSILEGEAAVRARSQKAAIKGDVLLAGLAGDSTPLDASRLKRSTPVIGVFTPKAVSWPTLADIIDDCRRHFHAARVVIRWHPSMLEPPRLPHLLADMTGIVESPRGAALADVARQCDWVVADENSNVHLPVLKLGIPTIAVRRLGLYPPSRTDMYGFAANRVVFPAVTSIREIDPAALASFFSDSWAARFSQYDVSYLRSQEAIVTDVRRAISALIEQSTPAWS